MKKILKIIILNLILILLAWVTCDFILYQKTANARKKEEKMGFKYEIPPFTYRVKPYFGIDMDKCFSGSGRVIFGGRKPDGYEYRNNTSTITVFGCSYALGQFLEEKQTLSYKLAQMLKCPVHNRALAGKGLQQMYQQSTLNSFYKTVPPSHTVIYVMINDHYRRMLLDHVDILDSHIVINYKKKGKKLQELNYNNPFRLLFNSSYLVKLFKEKQVKNYLENELNEEALTDEALCYFVETRKNLKERWEKDFNFVVILYGDISYEKTLKEKLRVNGFTVFNTRKDFGIRNTELEKYSLPDGHPNEKAWDTITPLLIKKLELK